VNKKIGVITRVPSLVCKQCAVFNNHIIDEWALSTGYPDGYTCDDCGDVYSTNGFNLNSTTKEH
jgi:hypothetical protein